MSEKKSPQPPPSESDLRFQAQYRGTPIPIYSWRKVEDDFELFDYNDAAYQITRGGVAGLVGRKASDLFGQDPRAMRDLHLCFEEKRSVPSEASYDMLTTGEHKHLKIHFIFVPPDVVMVYTEDVTAAKELEDALQVSERRFRALIENASEIISIHDAEGNMLYHSPAIQKCLGYDSEELVGRPVMDFISEDYVGLANAAYADILASPRSPITVETKFRHKDGSWLYFETTGTNLLDDPAVGGIVFNARDITDRKQVEERLLREAFYDPLTGLSNRARFLDHLAIAIAAKSRNAASSYAVLFLDLDRFKVVNDSLGHGNGDSLIQAVAGRLEQCLRACDIAARLGGDEFAILLTGAPDVGEATHVAERVLREVSRPYDIGTYEVFSSVSIGIVLEEAGGEKPGYSDPESVLRDADAAMYRAKAAGKGCYEIFNADMHARAVSQLHLENMLHKAVELAQADKSEFILHYQPIMSLQSGKIAGFEALIRWQHPERGTISPFEFIPIAEETGLIAAIGLWVLREACGQMSDWRREFAARGRAFPPLTMSVNVSGRQFALPDLPAQIAAILDQSGLRAGDLKVEITESALVQNEYAFERLSQLKEMGIALSMDDFGTGYSSLSYLHRFPIDTIKIDRSFISGLNADSMAIVRAIMSLSEAFQVDVVAEGVETQEQAQKLISLDCPYGQGYLWSKPVDGAAALRFLREHSS